MSRIQSKRQLFSKRLATPIASAFIAVERWVSNERFTILSSLRSYTFFGIFGRAYKQSSEYGNIRPLNAF